MNEALRVLKETGVVKIHEDTHIQKMSIDALLKEDFSRMNKIQFIGFISILEREYSLDLSNLKSKGLAYIEENSEDKRVRTAYIEPKQHSSKLIFILIGIAVLVAGIYYTMFFLSQNVEVIEVVDNKIIEEVQRDIIPAAVEPVIEPVVEENLTTTDNNLTLVEDTNVSEVVAVEEVVIPDTLTIILKSRKWFGYVDLSNHKKNSKTFKGKFKMDASKDWLLMAKPGTVIFKINGKDEKHTSKMNMRFKYIDAKLTKIKWAEWKKLNKGRTW